MAPDSRSICRTFQQLGVYGVGTITCIVSFDPKADWAHRFVPVAPEVIADQIEAATSAHDLDVVKIGMLGTPETIAVVANALSAQTWRHIVVDPVLICKGQEPGAALDTDNGLRSEILPVGHGGHAESVRGAHACRAWTPSRMSTI